MATYLSRVCKLAGLAYSVIRGQLVYEIAVLICPEFLTVEHIGHLDLGTWATVQLRFHGEARQAYLYGQLSA